MGNRLFVAINLPENIKRELLSYQDKIENLFPSEDDFSKSKRVVKWTKKQNLHITLVFLGYVIKKKVGKSCQIIEEVIKKHKSFSLEFNKICYAPPGKKPPRMIWLMGKTSNQILEIKKNLEKDLFEEKILRKIEKRKFTPHITLGRIRKWQWKRITPEERPNISEEISLKFKVNSIELMESKLKRGGPEYTKLYSSKLKS